MGSCKSHIAALTNPIRSLTLRDPTVNVKPSRRVTDFHSQQGWAEPVHLRLTEKGTARSKRSIRVQMSDFHDQYGKSVQMLPLQSSAESRHRTRQSTKRLHNVSTASENNSPITFRGGPVTPTRYTSMPYMPEHSNPAGSDSIIRSRDGLVEVDLLPLALIDPLGESSWCGTVAAIGSHEDSHGRPYALR